MGHVANTELPATRLYYNPAATRYGQVTRAFWTARAICKSPKVERRRVFPPTSLQLRCRAQDVGLILVLLLICCVTSGKSPNFSEPWFPQL